MTVATCLQSWRTRCSSYAGLDGGDASQQSDYCSDDDGESVVDYSIANGCIKAEGSSTISDSVDGSGSYFQSMILADGLASAAR